MSCFRIASDYDTCVTEKVSFFASFIVILGDCLLFSSPNSEKDNQNHSQIFLILFDYAREKLYLRMRVACGGRGSYRPLNPLLPSTFFVERDGKHREYWVSIPENKECVSGYSLPRPF